MVVKIEILLIMLPCIFLYESHLRLKKKTEEHSPKNELKS
jgi:hypothetical protein